MTKQILECKTCGCEMEENWGTKLFCSKACRSNRPKDVEPFTSTTLLALKYMMKNNPEQYVANATTSEERHTIEEET